MRTIEVLEDVMIVLWDYPSDDHPLVQTVRVAMEESGLPTRDAVVVSDVEAFRRAAKAMNDKHTKAEVFEKDGLFVEINRISVDPDATRLKRTLSGVWKHRLTGPQQVEGYSPTLHEELTRCWEHKKSTYEWGDIGKFLGNTFKNSGLGIHAMKASGGIYVVPMNADCRTLTDRAHAFCERINVRFVPLPTPDTEYHKNLVREAVANTIQQEIDEHSRCVANYSETTRPETFALRRSLMSQTCQYLIRVSGHLNGHASGLAAQLDRLEETIRSLESSAANAAQGMGRRVLTCK